MAHPFIRLFGYVILITAIAAILDIAFSDRIDESTVYRVRCVVYISEGLIVAWALLRLHREESSFRRAERLHWRVCVNCGYRLEGLEEQGICPECSTPYALTDMKERWLAWMYGTRKTGVVKWLLGTT